MRISCPSCQSKLNIKNPKLLGKQVKCPSCSNHFRLPAADSLNQKKSSKQKNEMDKSDVAESVKNKIETESKLHLEYPVDKLAMIETDYLDNRHMKNRLMIKKSNKSLYLIVTGVLLTGLVLAGFYYFNDQNKAVMGLAKNNNNNQPVPNNVKKEKNDKDSILDKKQDEKVSLTQTEISRKPIAFNNLPDGIRLVIYLRPDELLKLPEEKLQSFKPVHDWFKKRIIDQTGIPLELMESILIGFIPRSTGEFPHVVYQIQLLNDLNDEKVLESLSVSDVQSMIGNSVGTEGVRVYRVEPPKNMIGLFSDELYSELKIGLSLNSFVSTGIEKMLEETDKNSQFSIVWDSILLKSMVEGIENKDLKKFIELFSNWHGEETEAGLWDLSFGENLKIHAAFRNQSVVSEKKYRSLHQDKIENSVSHLSIDTETLDRISEGEKNILNQFPAMIQSCVIKTEFKTKPRLLVTETILPDLALDNLMVGSLLFWNRHNSRGVLSQKPETTKQKSLKERLENKIDIEFRRTPLKTAFEELAQTISAKMKINGIALKELGYTQNMPQTLKQDQIIVREAFQKILNQYEGMVMVLEEDDSILISTAKDVEKLKKKIYIGQPK